MTVRWWSQEFAPEGSAAAEGIVRQLGQPSLDPLTVLVREAAQNSADAGREDATVVEFRIGIRTLGEDAERWRQVLLPSPRDESGLAIERALSPSSVALVISDRNTVGLGGPIRANRRDSAERRSDFVQFLRNVGEATDHEFGGGTYGFGKGIFYRLSGCRAILVDTHTAEPGDAGRRLMGAALGPSWIHGDRRYTGRHWWGEVGEDDVPDPLLGTAAAAVAQQLGLPGFADGATGTDIIILGADLGVAGTEQDDQRPRTPQEAATFIRSSILWNLWPKFVPHADGRHMRFAVGVDGIEEEVPSPETLDEFEPFVESLRVVRSGQGTPYTRVTPPKTGGSFALALAPARSGMSRQLVTAACPFQGTSRHVARMRSVELVVDYVEGPLHPNPDLAYGAVFKASADADRAFAAAEPPTHDDWVVTGLSGSVRGVVQGARTFVSRKLDERLGFGSQSGGEGRGLGQLASRLASVIPGRLAAGANSASSASASTGADPASREGGSSAGAGISATTTPGRSRRGGVPRVLGSPMLEVYDDQPFAVARVLVPASEAARLVTAEAFVVVEGGGRETEPPTGAALPRIVQWQSAVDSRVVSHGAAVHLPPGPPSEWWVYATHVPDALVRLRLGQEFLDGE